jgi:hypothetical protein
VVGNFRVEGFASNGVDVIDVLMFDGRTHDLGPNQTCATCDDDLHVYRLIVCADKMGSRMFECCFRVESQETRRHKCGGLELPRVRLSAEGAVDCLQ